MHGFLRHLNVEDTKCETYLFILIYFTDYTFLYPSQ